MTSHAVTLPSQSLWGTRRLRLWTAATVVALVGFYVQTRTVDWLPHTDLAFGTVLAVFAAALACELLDSSLGMGYGTTLTPLLLVGGLEPLQIVPAVLLSELATGLAAGVMHHRDGNIDLAGDRHARRTLGLLCALSALGAVTAVWVALTVPKVWLGGFITAIVLAMGLVTLLTWRRQMRYRPGGIAAIGLVAAFNKGLSGGGYGPLVTAGQVVSGLPARSAVAITSFAEALTCAVGLATYLAAGNRLDMDLAPPLVAGAVLSVPLATGLVRRLRDAHLRLAVGALTCILGVVSLAKLVG